MSSRSSARPYGLGAASLLLLLAGGCGVLQQTTAQPTSFYSLERAQGTAAATAASASLTLIVNPPRASAGFASSRIIYVREAHKLEYFAHSEWVDPPARMLAPLIAASLEGRGTFRAVVPTPSAATGELRLDTEVVRLQHDFTRTPSRVQFTLRAHLVESATRRVLAWREFEAFEVSAGEDPRSGVAAANRAVQAVLDQLGAFCAEAAAGWKPPAAR